MEPRETVVLTVRVKFMPLSLHYFLKDFIYLLERERESVQAEGVAGRGRSRLPAEEVSQCGT